MRMAVEVAVSMAPPMPCTMRMPHEIERRAIAGGMKLSAIEASVKIGEAEIVDLGAAEHVAEAPEGHHQHGGDHHIAHDRPEQGIGIARIERLEADAAKDRRQADQDDRGVDRGGQHAERGVAQHHPLVAVAMREMCVYIRHDFNIGCDCRVRSGRAICMVATRGRREPGF